MARIAAVFACAVAVLGVAAYVTSRAEESAVRRCPVKAPAQPGEHLVTNYRQLMSRGSCCSTCRLLRGESRMHACLWGGAGSIPSGRASWSLSSISLCDLSW